MALKQEIETWVQALELCEQEEPDYEGALAKFESIGDSAKILFNIGILQATLGEHEKAVQMYHKAIDIDKFLAVAYFQCGVSNFLLTEFAEAANNFNDALLYLRGNNSINYEQLGLKFCLYSCEAIFNRGLCRLYSSHDPNDKEHKEGMEDLAAASKEKKIDAHNVIDEAITEGADGFTVFSVPVGTLYQPPGIKRQNYKTKDYLGKAKVVASADAANMHTGFDGTEKRQSLIESRPEEAKSFAASNLVIQDRSSKINFSGGPDPTFSPPISSPPTSALPQVPPGAMIPPGPPTGGLSGGPVNKIRDSVVTFRSSSFDASYRQSMAFDNGPPVELAQMKIKIHHNKNDKLRLMLMGPEVQYDEFIDLVKEKLGIRGKCTIELKDETDKVAMDDKGDLEAALVASKDMARRSRSSIGNVEIWVSE
ncbi:hypothetical protein H072_7080 [Dactylellina haptotyla CBS 200.50]|uniref:Uncharacterized protein n=1 Tax=Dactylellina haptotyla (strain CBS 200.50) TaxID=1284197 RepID=S8A8J6_DACHA|nr:hypothetical protein H072_7080 [Dactylellina haptotyla CBS 200.50]